MNRHVALVEPVDERLAERLFRARLSGKTLQAVADEFGVTKRVVRQAVLARLEDVDEESQILTLRENLTYLTGMMVVFHRRAIEREDTASALVCCKVNEQMLDILGRRHREIPIALTVQETPMASSTDKIKAILATAGIWQQPKTEPEPD